MKIQSALPVIPAAALIASLAFSSALADEKAALLVEGQKLIKQYAAELQADDEYVAEGGRALVLLDPFVAPGLAEDLSRYGVLVGNDAAGEWTRTYGLAPPKKLADLIGRLEEQP